MSAYPHYRLLCVHTGTCLSHCTSCKTSLAGLDLARLLLMCVDYTTMAGLVFREIGGHGGNTW